jgi:SAM-dependent methyltransferase
MSGNGEFTEYDEVADLYDHVDTYEYRADVPFWLGMAEERGGPVLELGCGTGRVLIPLARAGVEVVGLDLSKAMLDVCRQALAAEPDEVRARVELVQGDLRDFDLDREFPLIISPFRPFQHLITVREQMECLDCVRRHLSAEGRFVLDIFNPSIEHLADPLKLEEEVDVNDKVLPDGRRVTRTVRIVANDYLEQYRDVELVYYVAHPDGRKQRLVHRFLMRYLFRYEVEHLLVRCGLELETVYADYERSPYGTQYPGELVCVVRHV